MRLLAIAVLLLAFATAPALAADRPCNRQTATSVTVRQLLTNYAPYVETCVRIHGFVAQRSLYESIESFYDHRRTLPEPGYIGVYGTALQEDWLWAYRNGADLVGTLSACNLIEAPPPQDNVIVMIIGDCHYRDGPIIYVSELIPDPSTPRRLFGAEAYARYGALAPVAAVEIKAGTRRTIHALFDAIRRRDAKKMKALLKWPFDSRDGELADAVNPARSPYAFLIGMRRLPPIQYFRTTENDPRERTMEGCVCKQDDCTRIWPITRWDANAEEAWPYVCIEAYSGGAIAF